MVTSVFFVYYVWRKRKLKIRRMNEGRFDENSHTLVGSRFWFWVPFRNVGIKIGLNLNYEYTTLIPIFIPTFGGPK
jgi:hypothetical protein